MDLNIIINKVDVAESFNPGDTVATAIASGGTAPYVYSLARGEDKFAIDSSTGIITVIVAMNINNIDFFNVIATDSTNKTITSSTTYPPIQAELQSRFDKSNVIYEIANDFTLSGGVLIIPEGSTLDFQGGSIVNGTIVLNNTVIMGNTSNAINTCIVSGSIKGEVILDYLGVSPSNTAEVNYINYNNINLTNQVYKFLKGTYSFSGKIVPKEIEFKGSGKDTILNFPNSDGLYFPTHTPKLIKRYIGDFTIKANNNCIDLMADDASGVDGVNYSIFNNITLESINGNCFYSTIRNNYTYANKFTNLLLKAPNGSAFNNCALILTTILDKIDTEGSMKAFFYNCSFKTTQMSNCNIGWGANYGYLIYNDAGRGYMSSLLYSIKITNCNFEESITNAIVNLKRPDEDDFIALVIDFINSSFIYNDTLLGKEVYSWSGSNIAKTTITNNQAYFTSIIGYNIIFRAEHSIISYPTFIQDRTTRISMVLFNKDYLASWGFPGFSDDMPHSGTVNIAEQSHYYWKNEHNTEYLPILDKARAGMFICKGSQNWLWNGDQWMQLIYQKGLTSMRPELTSNDVGFLFYDSSISKYICWNGTIWTNIDGTSLT